MPSLPVLSLFPAEVWEIILDSSCLQRADLKRIRLVARLLNDIVTARLFEQVCFSANGENLYALNQLLQSESLIRHVNTLLIDTTVYPYPESKQHYAQMAQHHFHSNLALTTPPFHAQNLENILNGSAHEEIPGYSWPQSADIFCMGYRKYESAARFQENYISSDQCYVDLVHVLSSLSHLRTVALLPQWHLPSCHLQQLSTTTLDSNFRTEIKNSPSLSELIASRSQFRPLEHRGWVFTGPGPTARFMHPLHMPPVKDVLTVPANSKSITGHLIGALLACNTQLQQLSLSPISIIDPQMISYISKNTKLLTGIFRPLKTLTLYVHHITRLQDWRLLFNIHESFHNAIQSMKDIEVLSLRCPMGARTTSTNELFKLMLESCHPYRKSKYAALTCHRDEVFTSNVNDPRNFAIWLPSTEVLGHSTHENTSPIAAVGKDSPNSSPQLLRIMRSSPWPKLAKLNLHALSATKFDLASLMIMVAPSLRDLTLQSIELRNCPCDVMIRSYRRRRRERLYTTGEKHQWYDVAIMLNKVLNLEKCVIANWNASIFVQQVSHFLSRPGAEITPILYKTTNILGKYVLESKGESPALWLLNRQSAKGPLPRKRKASEIDLDRDLEDRFEFNHWE